MSIEQYFKIQNLRIEKYETLTSTNDVLTEKAKAGAPSGTVVISEHQTAGRGKQGRNFFSPAKTGLYMSILLRVPLREVNGIHITARAAVAVAKAIENQLGEMVQIKWMNDIYYRGRKVCGILAESVNAADEACIIVGIGVNLREPPHGFPEELKNKAGALFAPDCGDTDLLVSDIIGEFFGCDADLYEEYVSRSMLIRKKIAVYRNGEALYSAFVDRINQNFELCLTLPDGTKQALNSGDVSVFTDDVEK